MESIISIDNQYVANTYARFPLELVSGEGSILTDVNGKKYILNDNAMGIKWLRIDLDEKGGSFTYENDQGEKVIPFYMHENLFCDFPEDGYYNMRLWEYEEGYRHPVAVSASWLDDTTLGIKVQFIGNHLAGLFIHLGFDGERLALHMVKNTNCFLDKYNGYAVGISE